MESLQSDPVYVDAKKRVPATDADLIDWEE